MVIDSDINNFEKILQIIQISQDKWDNSFYTPKAIKQLRLLEQFQNEESKKVKDNNYDISVLNTSYDAEQIIQMVQNAIEFDKKHGGKQKGIRLLFYGVSGGGKTMLARHIAKEMKKEVLSKQASDIIGRYTGDSEKNLAKFFKKAQEEKKILILDEADSFFSRKRPCHTHMGNYTGKRISYPDGKIQRNPHLHFKYATVYGQSYAEAFSYHGGVQTT